MFVRNHIRKHKGAAAVGATGVIVVLAHIVLGVTAVLTAAQSGSGVVIGIVLIAAAALHAIIAHLRGIRSASSRVNQSS